jgi:hypothetical protein
MLKQQIRPPLQSYSEGSKQQTEILARADTQTPVREGAATPMDPEKSQNGDTPVEGRGKYLIG